MYKINLTLSNPLTGDSEVLIFQFDPATLTQAKWNAAFATLQASLNALKARSTPLEPATW